MSGGITAGTGMAIMGGAILGGAILSSQAAKGAASTQADAARYAADQNAAALDKQLQTAQPWVNAGEKAINQLSTMTQPGGELTQKFSYAPFDYTADPGYAFRFKEGMKALNANAAARGGLISGNALRAATGYGQELSSQEYQNAFDRYLKNRANEQSTFQMNFNNLVEPLKFISGQGQAGAANQASNIGSNTAANTALITGAANANAAGQIGSANAYTNAIGQGINAYQMNQLINRSSYTPASTNYYGGGSFATSDANSYGSGWGPSGYTGNNG